MTLTISDLIHNCFEKLKTVSDSPRLDAEILMSYILKISRFDLFLKAKEQIDEVVEHKFNDLIQRRLNNEPIAYIINEKPFFEDVFYVDHRVLIPRPETEFLVIEAIAQLKKYAYKTSVLDICCGSGCVGLSIFRVIDCNLTMSDISTDALDVAAINLDRLFDYKESVKIVKSDIFENIEGKYDLITANPPYLSADDMTEFVKGDLKHEPVNAFFGGENGFEFTEKILNNAHIYLKPGGVIAVELGFEGSKFIKTVYDKIKLEKKIKDYSGIDRVAVFSLCRQ
ncbi:MAG TPA: peptide chain release factor N(5)-glutamine methyltransferase [bacterium]|nr:peptide chain release factor N(5)-glutamine methyltransferase [bacterium]HQN73302.1 peptide chain release factor N(5)-glutamine methyltransferase [bacterium]HQO92493.1 peptide chain release factor N(5)-glutamine methyltransferase [bacterium]